MFPKKNSFLMYIFKLSKCCYMIDIILFCSFSKFTFFNPTLFPWSIHEAAVYCFCLLHSIPSYVSTTFYQISLGFSKSLLPPQWNKQPQTSNIINHNFLKLYFQEEISESEDTLLSMLLSTTREFSWMDIKVWTITSPYIRINIVGISQQHWILYNRLFFATVLDLIIALTCILLIITDVEHIFIYLLAIWISLSLPCLYLNYIHFSMEFSFSCWLPSVTFTFICDEFYFSP